MKKILTIVVLASFLATLLLVPEAEARERGRRRNRSTTENSLATAPGGKHQGYFQGQIARIGNIIQVGREHRQEHWGQFTNNVQNTVSNIGNGVQTFIATAPARRERRQEWINNNIVTPAVIIADNASQWASDHPVAVAAISGVIGGTVVALAVKESSVPSQAGNGLTDLGN